jgi:hypothetical protein
VVVEDAPIRPRLVFDSLREAPRPGACVSTSERRHLLYRARPFLIDLLLDEDPRTPRMVLSGQVVDTTRAGQLVRSVHVTVGHGSEELGSARPNEFGEFRCEFERKPGLVILVAIESRAPFAIPIAI